MKGGSARIVAVTVPKDNSKDIATTTVQE
jgi:hypothetical protein